MATIATIDANGVLPPTVTNIPPLTDGWRVNGTVNWSAYIKYTDNGRNDQSSAISGQSDNWTPLTIDFQGICMGGTVYLTVDAPIIDVTGATDHYSWEGSGNIIGTNPPPANVKGRLGSIPLQVIGYQESLPKWAQFGANGMPVVDSMNGFGIMQLTNSPAPSSTQIWNWQANVDAGVAKYQAGITVVNNHYNNLRSANLGLPAITAANIRYAYYQYYNAGNNFYWIPNSAKNGWVKNIPTYTQYGDNAVALEDGITAGQFPAGW